MSNSFYAKVTMTATGILYCCGPGRETKTSLSWLDYRSAPMHSQSRHGRTTWQNAGVEVPDIVMYLIHVGMPGEYTREKLKTHKSLDAYNCFASGWVGTCFIYEINKEFSVLKTIVKPCKSTPQQSSSSSLGCCEEEGWLGTSHCTCMAGWAASSVV